MTFIFAEMYIDAGFNAKYIFIGKYNSYVSFFYFPKALEKKIKTLLTKKEKHNISDVAPSLFFEFRYTK